jgi:hypothetical protein
VRHHGSYVWSVGAAGGATGGVGFAKARQRRERDRRIDGLGASVLMVIGNVTWRDRPAPVSCPQTTTKSCAGCRPRLAADDLRRTLGRNDDPGWTLGATLIQRGWLNLGRELFRITHRSDPGAALRPLDEHREPGMSRDSVRCTRPRRRQGLSGVQLRGWLRSFTA